MAKNQDARIYFESEYGKIYLGDSLELLKKTPDNSVNLIMTSPPFGLVRKRNMEMLMQINTQTGSNPLHKSFTEY